MSGNDDREDEKPKVSITLRTIVTGPEAGSIIGRGGEIVNSIRDESGAKIRIEGSSPQERIITVDGPTDSIFKVRKNSCSEVTINKFYLTRHTLSFARHWRAGRKETAGMAGKGPETGTKDST